MRDVMTPARSRLLLAASLVAVVVVVAAAIYIYGLPFGRSTTTHNAPPQTTALTPAAGETAFAIDASKSSATFTIREVLMGSPNTVVGKTSALSGEILANASNPGKSRMGPIKVDMTTLVTDNNMRNNTIQNRILETGNPGDQYATFTETSIQSAPTSIAPGQTVHFNVAGNLTVHSVTKPETFAVTLKEDSATQLSGSASATIHYADFDIAIPQVPSVAGVGNTVVLALNFTATRQA